MCEQPQGLLLPHQPAPCCVRCEVGAPWSPDTWELPACLSLSHPGPAQRGGSWMVINHHCFKTQPHVQATCKLVARPRALSPLAVSLCPETGQAVAGHSLGSGCCVASLVVALDLSSAASSHELGSACGGTLGCGCFLAPAPSSKWHRPVPKSQNNPDGSLGPCFMSLASSSFQLWPVGSEDLRSLFSLFFLVCLTLETHGLLPPDLWRSS